MSCTTANSRGGSIRSTTSCSSTGAATSIPRTSNCRPGSRPRRWRTAHSKRRCMTSSGAHSNRMCRTWRSCARRCLRRNVPRRRKTHSILLRRPERRVRPSWLRILLCAPGLPAWPVPPRRLRVWPFRSCCVPRTDRWTMRPCSTNIPEAGMPLRAAIGSSNSLRFSWQWYLRVELLLSP